MNHSQGGDVLAFYRLTFLHIFILLTFFFFWLTFLNLHRGPFDYSHKYILNFYLFLSVYI